MELILIKIDYEKSTNCIPLLNNILTLVQHYIGYCIAYLG